MRNTLFQFLVGVGVLSIAFGMYLQAVNKKLNASPARKSKKVAASRRARAAGTSPSQA